MTGVAPRGPRTSRLTADPGAPLPGHGLTGDRRVVVRHQAKTGHRARAIGERSRRRVDAGRPLLVVAVGKQHVERHRDHVGVAIKGVPIGVSELHRFGDQVHERCPQPESARRPVPASTAVHVGRVRQVRRVVLRQQGQGLQQDRALRPWTALVHGPAAVVVGDRRLVLGAVAGHVGGSQHPAVVVADPVAHRLLYERVDGFGHETFRPGHQHPLDLCFPPAVTTARSGEQPFPGLGQGRVAPALTGVGHPPPDQPVCGRGGPVGLEQGAGTGHRRGRAAREGPAVAGVGQGRFQHLGNGPTAVVCQEGQPGRRGSGHDCGEQTAARDEVQTLAAIVLEGGTGGRRPLAAEHLHGSIGPRSKHDGHVAGGAVVVGLDHVQYEGRRHRRVEGVAASLEHRHSRAGGQPVGTGGHGVATE